MRKIIDHLKENWVRHGFETFVVIAGVLIAFSLSDWNENRKVNKTRVSYLNRLKNDLQGDSENLAQLIEGRKSHARRVEHFNDLFDLGIYNPAQLKDSLLLVGTGLHRYLPLDITYEELINSGQIGLLNEKLRTSLAELDRTKDFYVIINATIISGFFAQYNEVRKYWNTTSLDFTELAGVDQNDEDILYGLRLEVNMVMGSYEWTLDNINRYEELIEGNNALIQLIDKQLTLHKK